MPHVELIVRLPSVSLVDTDQPTMPRILGEKRSCQVQGQNQADLDSADSIMKLMGSKRLISTFPCFWLSLLAVAFGCRFWLSLLAVAFGCRFWR